MFINQFLLSIYQVIIAGSEKFGLENCNDCIVKILSNNSTFSSTMELEESKKLKKNENEI